MSDEILVNDRFWQFEKAREYINSLKFKSISDFKRWWTHCTHATEDTPPYINGSNIVCPQRPSFLPYCPEAIYGRKFTNIHDYVLGRRAKRVDRHSLQTYPMWTFGRSSAFLRRYAFASSNDFIRYCRYSAKQQPGDPNYINDNNISCPKKPQGLPSTPRQTLYKTWTNWNEFLYGIHWKKVYITYKSGLFYQYEVSKKYIKQLKFRNIEDYYNWIDYSLAYKPGDPLFVTMDGMEIRRKPLFIPNQPNKAYRGSWISLHSYLSLHNAEDSNKRVKAKIIPKIHPPFDRTQALTYEEAREYIRIYQFSSYSEFHRYAKHTTSEPFVTKSGFTVPCLPCSIPRYPESHYKLKNTWVSWNDFLGIQESENNYDKIAEFMEKTKYVHYRSVAEWRREAEQVGPGLVGYINRAARLHQWDGFHSSLSRVNNSKCSYLDAKILLSFRDLKNQSQYIKWYKQHKFPFFMPSLESHQTLQQAYNDDSVTIEDYLSIDIVDKLTTRKLASPVFAITLTHGNDFRLDIIQAGKFEAYLRYAGRDNSYIFDLADINILNEVLSVHCTKHNNVEYTAKHLGQLYAEIKNHFKQINFAAIYD